MKKGLLVLLVFTVVAGSAFADFDFWSFPPPVQAGSIMVDAGLGLRALVGDLEGHEMSFPPLFAQIDYALTVGFPISVGGGITVGRWEYEIDIGWGYRYGWTLTYIPPHIRANWHWGFDVPWLDLYTGLSLGFDIASMRINENIGGGFDGRGAGGSRIFFGIQAGAHFYFTENVGAMVETGYPFWLKAGVALKFGGGSSSTQRRR